MRHIIVKLPGATASAPSAPQLGTPINVTFDSITVPLAIASTGSSSIASYTIERALTSDGPWTVAATGAGIFGGSPPRYVDGGRLALTTYYYRAYATDSASRVSQVSNIVSATTTALAGQKNWNPGNYIAPGHPGYPVKDVSITADINTILNHPGTQYIQGIVLSVPWARCERVKNVYTFDWLDTRINQCTANNTNNKQIILHLAFSRAFGPVTNSGAPNPTYTEDSSNAIWPEYLAREGYISNDTSNGGSQNNPTWHESYVLGRFEAWLVQLFDRYGNNPRVEMIESTETDRTYDGINVAANNNNWIQLANDSPTWTTGKKAWFGIMSNGLPTVDLPRFRQLIDAMVANDVSLNSPDTTGWQNDNSEPAPPGADFNTTCPYEVRYNANAVSGFPNANSVDRRMWIPCAPEHQIIRDVLTHSGVKWYADNWWKSSHTRWQGQTSGYAGEFQGLNATLSYIANVGWAPARQAYPSRL